MFCFGLLNNHCYTCTHGRKNILTLVRNQTLYTNVLKLLLSSLDVTKKMNSIFIWIVSTQVFVLSSVLCVSFVLG